jgi:hypothetical protein
MIYKILKVGVYAWKLGFDTTSNIAHYYCDLLCQNSLALYLTKDDGQSYALFKLVKREEMFVFAQF